MRVWPEGLTPDPRDPRYAIGRLEDVPKTTTTGRALQVRYNTDDSERWHDAGTVAAWGFGVLVQVRYKPIDPPASHAAAHPEYVVTTVGEMRDRPDADEWEHAHTWWYLPESQGETWKMPDETVIVVRPAAPGDSEIERMWRNR